MIAVRRLISVLFLFFFAATLHAAPVLMISIDGLKPEYITQADAHGLKIPFLRTLLVKGTYADGVVGVYPTVTYPSHTTLITGVSPAEHGIFNNLEFDPLQQWDQAWNWYAAQIRVPTLWSAAHAAGMTTASLGWPVSVGATDVDYLIPEYWRSNTKGESLSTNPLDRDLIAALSRPDHLLSTLEPAAGPYFMGEDDTPEGDEIKTRYALEILRRYKPALFTLHLSSLDETEHMHGPFSPEADANMEALDGMVARLVREARQINPATVLVLVSDHGFEDITHFVNLIGPFVKYGFVQATADPATGAISVQSWKAEPWPAGGMAAIMLKDPSDHATEERVGAMLKQLAAMPDSGIDKVLDRAEIAKTGGFPDAAYLVLFKPGYYFGTDLSGKLITPVPGHHGSHGFSPTDPQMRASFFALGQGVAAGRDLGIIDMRQIAPTVARILGVQLPTAKAAPLALRP